MALPTCSSFPIIRKGYIPSVERNYWILVEPTSCGAGRASADRLCLNGISRFTHVFFTLKQRSSRSSTAHQAQHNKEEAMNQIKSAHEARANSAANTPDETPASSPRLYAGTRTRTRTGIMSAST